MPTKPGRYNAITMLRREPGRLVVELHIPIPAAVWSKNPDLDAREAEDKQQIAELLRRKAKGKPSKIVIAAKEFVLALVATRVKPIQKSHYEYSNKHQVATPEGPWPPELNSMPFRSEA